MKYFIKALKNHAKVRGLASTDAYWVCAYANSQHDLSNDVTSDPAQSSFSRALDLCLGVPLGFYEVSAMVVDYKTPVCSQNDST